MTRITEEQLQARRRAESIRASLKNLGKGVYTQHPGRSTSLTTLAVRGSGSANGRHKRPWTPNRPPRPAPLT